MKQRKKATAAVAGAARTSHRPKPENPEVQVTEAAIAARAYSYWEARGFEGGSPEEDWHRAVEELTRDNSQ